MATDLDRSAASIQQREGILAGIAAYGVWGLFPLYFHHLDPASAIEILCHRILWSMLLCAVVLAVRRRNSGWREWFAGGAAWTGPVVARLAAAALLVATNWVVYIWAVNHDHVVEAALGYFINPLITVGIGVVALGERLRRAQWIAVVLGVAAVAVLTVAYGRVPWISLVLATSFAGYGYLKKLVPFGPIESLAGETALLAPVALVAFVALQANGSAAFGRAGWGNALLLVVSGPVTTVPLVLFAASARRIPLTLLGLLQYLTPIGQFLCGVLVFEERLSSSRWVGFGLVWAALVVLTSDAFRDTRRASRPVLEVS